MELKMDANPELRLTRGTPFGIVVTPNGTNPDPAQGPNLDLRELSPNFLRELVWQEQLVVLRGFQNFQSQEDFVNFSEGFGTISLWPFGKVLDIAERPDPEDHIFANHYVPLHWDGMYRPQVPELQVFYCVRACEPGQGGRTLFSHTPLALANAPTRLRTTWEKVTGSYQRKMEYYDSKTISPVVTQHPFRYYEVIRYNEPPRQHLETFVNPPSLQFSGLEHVQADFHEELRDALYSPKNLYAHEWQTGDVVLADNFTLLHGRESFVPGARRHLRRIHILSSPPLQNPGLVYHQ